MKKKSFRHASLFTGIGGFDLAASWMGWQNIFQCEIDPFCQRVLKYRFPESKLFSDIKTSKFNQYHGTIGIISGGFPCQPFSVAGKRKGTDDNRYLWPEMLRAIREILPLWVVAENVGGILTMQSGVVFECVCADLEDAGYGVQSFVIPACAVGAPHRRDRVWIIAHTDGYDAERYGYGKAGGSDGTHQSERNVPGNGATLRFGEERNVADAAGAGLSATPPIGSMERRRFVFDNSRNTWERFPTQSSVCSGDDGLSLSLDGITFSKWRNESIKAYGNAIVPQIAYQIFRAIEKVETKHDTSDKNEG